MTDKIRRLLKKGKTAKEIALALKIEPNRVHTVKWLDGKKKDNIRAKKWAKKNSWFGIDKKKTAKALEAHEDLMNRGVHPTKQPKKYWAEVDKAVKYKGLTNTKYNGLTNTQAALAKKLRLKNATDFKKVERRSKIIETARITKAELDALLPKPKKPRKIRITRKKLLKELQPGLDALFGLEYKKQEAPTPDLVNNPPHYKSGGIETIDFIEAKDLNYRLGNVVKYVSRAGRKAGSDPVVDLEKAAFYLQREINARKGA